jgi:hypothetical protein
MSAPTTGWYPDPSGSPALRWWDGSQWTHHVAPQNGPAPAVAPPSPTQPASAPGPTASGPATNPNWAAEAPAGSVLFDEKISGVGVNGRQLRITPEHLVWGKTTISLADVRGVAYWVVHHYTNAVPSGIERNFVLAVGEDSIKVPLHSAKLNPTKRKNEGYYERLVQISEQLIEPRLHDEAMAAIAAGRSVSFGKLSYDQTGIHFAGKKGTDSYPWRSVQEVELDAGNLVITTSGSGAGQGMLLKLPLSSTNTMIAARLVATCASRYS